MNRQVLSIVALILLLLSAFNSTTMARTLPKERISASIKVGMLSGSVSGQARKKGPGAPGKQNR
ncbi:unnamed protein product [Brassica rapa subsp. narinosa]